MTVQIIDDNVIKLTSEKNQSFLMHFAGADFYWTMLEYNENNEFIITEEDNFLFSKLNQLFEDILIYDNPYDSILINNIFTWVSEDFGLYEDANKLMISFNNNVFNIKFHQNPNRLYNRKDTCSICFCLSGSKNQNIASSFSIMYYDCQKHYIKKLIK